MNEEEKKAINNMKIFARVHQDMTVVTAEEMNIVLKLIEKLQKENEELKNQCEISKTGSDYWCMKYSEFQKENEELKEERQIVGIPVRNKRDGRIGIVLHQWESGSVAVLESINPRVINTHDSWNTLEIVTDEVKQTQTKCETIPVSLVKDNIEELKQEKKKYGNCLIEMYEDELVNRDIKILQELLEKNKIN